MIKCKRGSDDSVLFWCPGCDEAHGISVAPGRWTWSGNEESPTFSPSVLVRSGHHAPGHSGDCWCNYEERFGEPSPFHCRICHSFVNGGMIQFLGDCSHALAGQTVPLPDWETAHLP